MKKACRNLLKSAGMRLWCRSIINTCLPASLFVAAFVSVPYAVVSNEDIKANAMLKRVVKTKDASHERTFTNEIIIKVKSSNASTMTSISGQDDADDILSRTISGYAIFKNRHQVKNVRRLIRDQENLPGTGMLEKERIKNIKRKYTARSARANSRIETPALSDLYIISVDSKSKTVEQAAKELSADSAVEYAVPNRLYRTQYVPSDPLYAQQWSHTVTSAQAAWDIERGQPSVAVAIIDCGVDYTHEDLAENMLSPCGSECAPGTGYDFVDIDTNYYKSYGYTMCPGEDYTQIDANPMDYNGHGTHCAGIVAAAASNGKGVCGIAPGVKIMPVRAGFSMLSGSDEFGALEGDDIANAIRYAADNGADIISMSFGGGIDPVIQDAVAYAASLGVVLVAAAGNGSSNTMSYPAAYDNVISVAATGLDNVKAWYSNYGSWVDIAAPGGNEYVDNQIISTVPKTGGILSNSSGYLAISGTSMAAPYIAGVAALILSRNTARTVDQMTKILLQSVDNPSESISYIGVGRVNVLKAVSASPVSGMASITAPFSHELYTRISPDMSVFGTALASGWNYRLSFGAGLYPSTWTTLASGPASVINGDLGRWYISTLSVGYYSLRVSINMGADSVWTTTPVYVDNSIRDGWPQTVTMVSGMGFGNGSTLADVDNDGCEEIFIKTNSAVFGFKSDGTRLPGWPAATGDFFSIETSGATTGPSISDIDNDGTKEICAVFGHQIYAWSSIGTIKPGFPASLGDPWIMNNTDMPLQLADLDNDGTLELIIKARTWDTIGYDRIEVFSSRGDRYKSWFYEFTSLYGKNAGYAPFGELSFIDFNHDGLKEVIGLAENNSTKSVALFIWNYDGTLKAGYPIEIPNSSEFPQLGKSGISPVVADIDNDGEIEIGFAPVERIGDGTFTYIKTDGSHKSGWPIQINNQAIRTASAVDLDNDGTLETILSRANGITGQLIYVIGSNGLIWQGYPLSIPNYSFSQTLVSDIDNDGSLDIILADIKGTIYAWNKNGTPLSGFPRIASIWGSGIQSTPSIGDIDGDGKSELVASTSNGLLITWDLDGKKIPGSFDWPQDFQNPKLNLLSDAVLNKYPSVGIRGSWVKGNTHAKEPGKNRALVVMLYGEGSKNISASSVKYGGQTMTKVTEKSYLNGAYSYTGAFILNEAGIAAASSGAIAVTWGSAPTTGSDVVSVFIANANQTTPIGATATGSIKGTTISTSALATSAGDMVLVAGTAANNGTYTINNEFTRGITETSASFGDITSAYKTTNGESETPSLTSSASQRQTIVGFVVKKSGPAPVLYTISPSAGSNGTIDPSGNIVVNKGDTRTFTITPNSGYQVDSVTVDGINQGEITSFTFSNITADHTIAATFKAASGTVSILGSWVKGATHAQEPGMNRALVVMLYGEGSRNISASSVKYGGQTMTKVTEKSYLNGAYSYTGAFILNEAGIAAASSGAIAVTWGSAPTTGSEIVSVFLAGVNQTTPIGAQATGSVTGTTVTTSALATSAGDLVLAAGTAANNGTYTINNGFTRGIAETSASFGDITSAYKPATGASETPSLKSSASQRQTIVGFVVKKGGTAPVQ